MKVYYPSLSYDKKLVENIIENFVPSKLKDEAGLTVHCFYGPESTVMARVDAFGQTKVFRLIDLKKTHEIEEGDQLRTNLPAINWWVAARVAEHIY